MRWDVLGFFRTFSRILLGIFRIFQLNIQICRWIGMFWDSSGAYSGFFWDIFQDSFRIYWDSFRQFLRIFQDRRWSPLMFLVLVVTLIFSKRCWFDADSMLIRCWCLIQRFHRFLKHVWKILNGRIVGHLWGFLLGLAFFRIFQDFSGFFGIF